ncbi:MAG: 3-phosphoglycerate dehydrogenase [Verrucomicrobiaceae bacterium]|jgi:D-3-phosphoglycerate dehydrogenase / 2-oxoglutarate reductase|nr:phosphoglycerate dehydrogenase [Verrucomicrobiales bacterium]MDA7525606.1 phosphoglycerate dehydrogenase [Verrucomicrobiales bacterium]MDC0503155.1 phosphoglycerate dehydrogenase [Verrucomicrobiales bacterium]NCF90381.1 3-phosphoglycerate dehydrogenase [Verrucomicrobiaceae bacterium]
MKRILLSTTSYQDTPGDHHALLDSQDFEIVRRRGPLSEGEMLELGNDFDGAICGDDAFTRQVIEKMLPRLKVLSKYGIGLDKIDLDACQDHKIPVLFTPGVNHTTVAEHAFCILLAGVRNLIPSVDSTRAGGWKRITGHEIWKKKMGIIGLGRIGQAMAQRAHGFEMEVHGFDLYWPDAFVKDYPVTRHESALSVLREADVITLHTNLSDETRDLINEDSIAEMKDDAWLINTARGELVNAKAVVAALNAGKLAGYVTDVLDEEPPAADHPLLNHPKAIVTPHIGSRTYESVPRQAMRATTNLVNWYSGEGEVLQANKF